MTRISLFSMALVATFLGSVALAPSALADEHNQKIIVTFTEPVEVPGAVTLQPGRYVFKLQDSKSDRQIVLIQNERENHTYAQVFATDGFRVVPKGKAQFIFWETPAGQPQVLRAVFWPGRHYGEEFMYKKDRAAQITSSLKTKDHEVPVEPDEQAASK